MNISYSKEAGAEKGRWSVGWDGPMKGRWSVGWDGPKMMRIVRDTLIILACGRFLGLW